MIPQLTRPPDQPAGTADRRLNERLESSRPLPRRLYRVEDFRNLDAWITELSRGGLALLLSEPLATATLLFVELESRPDARPVRVWASVVRCSDLGDNTWSAGCELVNPLEDDDLDALLC